MFKLLIINKLFLFSHLVTMSLMSPEKTKFATWGQNMGDFDFGGDMSDLVTYRYHLKMFQLDILLLIHQILQS